MFPWNLNQKVHLCVDASVFLCPSITFRDLDKSWAAQNTFVSFCLFRGWLHHICSLKLALLNRELNFKTDLKVVRYCNLFYKSNKMFNKSAICQFLTPLQTFSPSMIDLLIYYSTVPRASSKIFQKPDLFMTKKFQHPVGSRRTVKTPDFKLLCKSS